MQNGRWTGTTVYPNGGTEVTAHYRDGGVYTVSGTAVTATKYLHSIVNGLRVTRTVWPDAQGGPAGTYHSHRKTRTRNATASGRAAYTGRRRPVF